MKKIDRSQQVVHGGVALVHLKVNAMGFQWHERSRIDAGIDGEIELCDPLTGDLLNRYLLVQIKTSDGKYPGENDRGFHYVCRQPEVDYWMSAELPVLLVFSRPATGEAWWAHVQSSFQDPARRAEGRIEFDKGRQRFDAGAGPSLHEYRNAV